MAGLKSAGHEVAAESTEVTARLTLRPLPLLHFTGDHAKDRMRFRGPYPDPPAMQIGIPLLELVEQVTPFVCELSRGCRQMHAPADRADLGRIEGITTAFRFQQHRRKIGIDRRPGSGM